MTACLLHNEPATYSLQQGEAKASRSESESEQGDQLLGVDAKRDPEYHGTREIPWEAGETTLQG